MSTGSDTKNRFDRRRFCISLPILSLGWTGLANSSKLTKPLRFVQPSIFAFVLLITVGFTGEPESSPTANRSPKIGQTLKQILKRNHALKLAEAAETQEEKRNALRALQKEQKSQPVNYWTSRLLLELSDLPDPVQFTERKTTKCGPLAADLARIRSPEEDLLDRATSALKRKPLTQAQILLKATPTPERLFRAWNLLTAAGRTQKSKKVAKRLAIEFPASREANAIKPPKLTTKEHLRRLRNLLQAHRNQEVIDESKHPLDAKASRNLHCAHQFLRGKAFRKMRRYREALKTLRKAQSLCATSTDYQPRVLLLTGQIENIRGQTRALAKTAQKLAAKFPEHSFTDDAFFLLAERQEKQGATTKALNTYRHIVDKYPHSDHAAPAAWRIAFSAIKNRKFKAALSDLEQIRNLPRRRMERDRIRYWLTKLRSEKTPEHAESLWREFIIRPSFYSFLALNHLRSTNPDLAEKLTTSLRQLATSEVASPVLSHPQLKNALLFEMVEQRSFATTALIRTACASRENELLLSAGWLLNVFGEKGLSQRVLRIRADSLLNGSLDKQNLIAWRLLYSRPFLELFEDASEQESLPELLLLSLAREESTFDPDIVSWAGATGLGQLMPSTAVQAYADVFHGRLPRQLLTDPKTNIRLAAHVLREGLRNNHNSVPLALAEYNGGPRIAKLFARRRDRTPTDLWIEDLPVKETRRYIKRVVETWGVYRLLHGKSKDFVPRLKR